MKGESMKDYKHAVFIGRFQPFHNGHLEVVKHALSIAENVIIIVGSMAASPSTRNPFGVLVRQEMVSESIYEAVGIFEGQRVQISSMRDFYNNDNAWLSGVQAKTDYYIEEGDSVALVGSFKDASSYYLRLFPQWEFVPVKTPDIDSTTIREAIFAQGKMADWESKPSPAIDLSTIGKLVPPAVLRFLATWVTTSKCTELCKEWKHQEDYKASFAFSPYPPTHLTGDAVVTCSGHVLVVERGRNPGKGLFAVPGGFLMQKETLQQCALRELKEETRIKVDMQILKANIRGEKMFDYPERSLRGRTVTQAFHIDLGDGRLPEVRGGDDAKRAFWMPFFDVTMEESSFFEDHAHIIRYFIGGTDAT